MGLARYRATPQERLRTEDLLGLVPAAGEMALDVGARDGHFSASLAERFRRVIALDLERPDFELPGVDCVAGDVVRLAYPDRHFDFVFCAEVLEHVPVTNLEAAAGELARVTRRHLLVGVPFRQDLRVARTRCQHCGKRNPPWGHVSAFDLQRLAALFPDLVIERSSYVGENVEVTNAVSSALMDFAGNPFGTYIQHEPCVYCGHAIGQPLRRTPVQRLATRLAVTIDNVQRRFTPARPNWIHILFMRP